MNIANKRGKNNFYPQPPPTHPLPPSPAIKVSNERSHRVDFRESPVKLLDHIYNIEIGP